jgi:hypothetical protein
MEEVKVGGLYKHFKGNYYVVQAIGYDSSDCKKVVIYKALYLQDGEFKTWVRPYDDFVSEVDRETYKGPRFTYIEYDFVGSLCSVVWSMDANTTTNVSIDTVVKIMKHANIILQHHTQQDNCEK